MKRLATYDNPVTYRREVYFYGLVVRSHSPNRYRLSDPFEPGRLVGDRRALRPHRPIRSANVKPWGAV